MMFWLNMFVGPPANGWHTGTISMSGDTLKWGIAEEPPKVTNLGISDHNRKKVK